MSAVARKRRVKPSAPIGESSGLFDQLDAEAWLAQRLQRFGVIFDGDTTPELRAERARTAIREAHLSMTLAGRGRDGKPETFQDAYRRIYGVNL